HELGSLLSAAETVLQTAPSNQVRSGLSCCFRTNLGPGNVTELQERSDSNRRFRDHHDTQRFVAAPQVPVGLRGYQALPHRVPQPPQTRIVPDALQVFSADSPAKRQGLSRGQAWFSGAWTTSTGTLAWLETVWLTEPRRRPVKPPRPRLP